LCAGTVRLFKDQGSRVQSLNPDGFKDFFLDKSRD
jgi:hypothetical protein